MAVKLKVGDIHKIKVNGGAPEEVKVAALGPHLLDVSFKTPKGRWGKPKPMTRRAFQRDVVI